MRRTLPDGVNIPALENPAAITAFRACAKPVPGTRLSRMACGRIFEKRRETDTEPWAGDGKRKRDGSNVPLSLSACRKRSDGIDAVKHHRAPSRFPRDMLCVLFQPHHVRIAQAAAGIPCIGVCRHDEDGSVQNHGSVSVTDRRDIAAGTDCHKLTARYTDARAPAITAVCVEPLQHPYGRADCLRRVVAKPDLLKRCSQRVLADQVCVQNGRRVRTARSPSDRRPGGPCP